MIAMRMLVAVACTILACAADVRAGAVPFLLNGSFETGPAPGNFIQLLGGSTSISGWTVRGQGINYAGTLWQHANGSCSLDLNDTEAGGVQQTFATTPGQIYRVDFSMAGNMEGPPTIKELQVSAAGQFAVLTFNGAGRNNSNMGWESKSFQFTANFPNTTLIFDSLTSGGHGQALDNVSVIPIPEPAGFSVLALAGLAAMRRQRRHLRTDRAPE